MKRIWFDRKGASGVVVVLAAVLCIIVAAGIGILLGYYTSNGGLWTKVKEIQRAPFDGKRVVRILVLGEDNTGLRNDQKRGLSDTIILASVDLDAGTVSAISIPRDTLVDLNGYGGTRKINAAHVLGGPSLTKLAVYGLTGLQADYYIKTDVEGFKKCVDILGGVEIDVEKNMHYIDRRGGLYINLKKGLQLLDGEKAMEYVRFRHDTLGDISRIQRQQKFLQALAKKALSPVNLPKLPALISAMHKYTVTDMTTKDLLALAHFLKDRTPEQVKMATLPGSPKTIHGVSYWIPDQEKASMVLRELFFHRAAPVVAKIHVLNGCGVQGAANRLAELLKQQGYEVAKVGNAPRFDYALSEVVYRNGSSEQARQVASALGINIIRPQDDQSSEADVTIIVGRDRAPAVSGT